MCGILKGHPIPPKVVDRDIKRYDITKHITGSEQRVKVSFSIKTKLAGALMLVSVGISAAPEASPPEVLVTVKPIHSLVASVMADVATPKLLLKNNQTPHSYTLVPSDAKALSTADIVIWVGEPLETFLEGPLETLASKADVLELASHDKVALRENRIGGIWKSEVHEHSDHDHDHDHQSVDGHIWLDPSNAVSIIEIVTEMLSATDPENAVTYANNAEKTIQNVRALELRINQVLDDARGEPFLVAHDALQYFDKYFDLNAVGAISITPDRAPSAKRLSDIRKRVEELGSVCLFSEPGYSPKVMTVVAESAGTRAGVLDPLGAEYASGEHLYFELMDGLARNLADCLVQS